jgi:hypothetical protein
LNTPFEAGLDTVSRSPIGVALSMTAANESEPAPRIDEEPVDMADLPGLRTEAEWDQLSKNDEEAAGTQRPIPRLAQSIAAKRSSSLRRDEERRQAGGGSSEME